MRKSLFLSLAFLLLFTACSGRIPSQVKAAKVAKKHFQKYGKKYKETDFGTSKVQSVEVKEVQELQKNVATGFLLVKLDSGTEIPVIMTFIRKLPMGWESTGWERVSE